MWAVRTDLEGLTSLAQRIEVDLVVVGPEVPLGRRRQTFEIGGRHIVQLRQRADAVPGRGMQRCELATELFQASAVLACPRSDHQNAHGCESTSALHVGGRVTVNNGARHRYSAGTSLL